MKTFLKLHAILVFISCLSFQTQARESSIISSEPRLYQGGMLDMFGTEKKPDDDSIEWYDKKRGLIINRGDLNPFIQKCTNYGGKRIVTSYSSVNEYICGVGQRRIDLSVLNDLQAACPFKEASTMGVYLNQSVYSMRSIVGIGVVCKFEALSLRK